MAWYSREAVCETDLINEVALVYSITIGGIWVLKTRRTFKEVLDSVEIHTIYEDSDSDTFSLDLHVKITDKETFDFVVNLFKTFQLPKMFLNIQRTEKYYEMTGYTYSTPSLIEYDKHVEYLVIENFFASKGIF